MIVSSQTAVKGKHGFEIRICAAGTGTKYKIAPTVFEVYTPDQASFRLFLCVCYHQNRHSYLERVQLIPSNYVSQDLMRFWSCEFF